MANRDILLIGASAGGVQALSKLVAGLPADLPAAVFIVLHVAPHGRSAMPVILSRAGHLPAVHAEDGQPVEPGRIYVAPPDHHIVLEGGEVRLSRAPTENAQRPAVDVLFRTAAQAYGRRVVAVVLTGNLDDGTAGLAVVKRHGGTAVIQDPEDADYPSMPLSAIHNVQVDHVLPLSGIAPLLVELVREPLAEEPELPEPEGRGMKGSSSTARDSEGQGVASDLTCPDCGGSLREGRTRRSCTSAAAPVTPTPRRPFSPSRRRGRGRSLGRGPLAAGERGPGAPDGAAAASDRQGHPLRGGALREAGAGG